MVELPPVNMPLAPGSRLGAYEVLAPLGAGGMGEVYRARDTRLGRDVAIKVLPAERLADEHRRRRFVREAQALSFLNHPHIVTIHEIESAGEIDFIVMELVHGTNLDTVVPRHGLPLNELMRIAIPVADALAAAHARGIIHRDLKPANVIVGEDGAVKVVDFGLAKLMELEADKVHDTATDVRDAALSAPGRVAGTAAYMAPEQAAGGKVDARSDIFSFGATLYEMATGTRAFAGDSMADMLAAVVRAQPKPPTQIVTTLPRELERLILRCLRKEPERRYQTMLDVRNELQEIEEESDSFRTASPVPAAPRSRSAMTGALAAALLVVTAAAWLLWQRNAIQLPPTRVVPLTALDGYEMMPTLSPDGNQVAFAWNGDKESGNVDIYVAMLGSPTVHRLTTDPAMDVFPSWSPDGRHIAFVRQRTDLAGRVYLISPLGGAERKLNDFDVHFDRIGLLGQLSWSADGRFIVAARSSTQPIGESTGIYLLPVDGAQPRAITGTKAPASDRDPAISPDGRRLAYFRCGNCCWGECDVMTVELNSSVVSNGPPRRLTSIATQMEGLAWSRDSRTVLFGVAGLFHYLWRIGIDGRMPAERVEVAGLGARLPATSRSHNRVVFGRAISDTDVYRVDATGPPRAIGVSSFNDGRPVFSPDGQHVAFCSARSGETMEIWMAAVDGSGARQLTRNMGRAQCSVSWAPHGPTIAFWSEGQDGQWHIWTIDIDGGNLRQITTGAEAHSSPEWSRDGAWIYFGKRGVSGSNIWRIPARGGRQQQVTFDEAHKGVETADGKHLVYQRAPDRAGSPLLLVPLAGGSSRQLVTCVYGFSVGSEGVYYYPCRPNGAPVPLAVDRSLDVRLIDPGTGHDQLIATLPDVDYGGMFFGPRFAPDGKTIVYGKLVNHGEDLMMIENFR